MAAEPPSEVDPAEDVRPPLGTWGRLYAVVIGTLVVEIVLLWALSRAFA
jgi:hypothetical protein